MGAESVVLIETLAYSVAGGLAGYLLGWVARDMHDVRLKVDRLAERRRRETALEPKPEVPKPFRRLDLTITPDWSDPRWDRRKRIP